MKLLDLLKDVEYKVLKGNAEVEVKDIVYDSRKANGNNCFVALIGFRVDGHDYINSAIKNGCKVIIVCRDIDIKADVTVIKLSDTRVDLAKLARTLFNYPDKELTTIAITGTKGKTTTSVTVSKMLEASGNKCGVIGTMGVFYGDKHYHTVNTTPESYDIYKYMREMLDNGVKYLVMEVSSQSLKLNRFNDIVFDYGVFTNLSLDHVGKDEHDSYEEYVYCKSLLFKKCVHGIFNIDDNEYNSMIKDCTCDISTFGKSSEADLRLVSFKNIIEPGFIGIDMEVEGIINDKFRVSVPGEFSAYNAMCVMSIVNKLGISTDIMKKVFENISVKGRLEPVKVSSKFNVLIDYAYQGIAMENVMKTIKESNPKRIVAVFGCGGNRSRQRRFDCGEIAGKLADLSILTADNSRYENTMDIIDDILVGMNKSNGKYVVVPDRRDAIKYSLVNAREGDVILILGKGHEDYQEVEGVRYPFDERIVIKEIIEEMTLEEKESL